MLCIGGPKHGEDIECRSPCFFALRERPPFALYSTNARHLPNDPVRVARYERRTVLSDGKHVPVWVVA